MECITHFSHDHPLSFFQLNDFDDPKPYTCSICGLPILHSPSYTCSLDANCNFFLHKPCTQLPREFYHHGHSDTLSLEQRTGGFAYKCRNYSKCKFDVHPLAAKAVEIKSDHISHNSHPLLLFCKEILCQCDACGEEQEGFFFYCQECDFWVHQDCAILPIIVRLRNHPHPYILTYSTNILNSPEAQCLICGEPWRLRYNGVYFCCETYLLAHITCANSNMEDLQTNAIEELIQLPQEDDAFPSLVISRFTERNPSSSSQIVHHKHPLILVDVASSSRKDLVCDVCVQPMMSSPICRCQSDGCHFLAHHICANRLPTSIKLLSTNPLSLTGVLDQYTSNDTSDAYIKNFFSSVFFCYYCRRPTNGFMYLILNQEEDPIGFCDIECALTPKIIKHASHRQHVLYQVLPVIKTLIPVVSCCSGESLFLDTYRCVACDFSIHIRCALLPNKTRHKFDEHPLELIMSHEDNKLQEVFCEVCEQEIDLKLWYYGCHACEQYFHVNCIPSVGHMSKVKFGKTLADDKIHPNHPLTLTWMLTHGRHERCELCKQIIQGFAHDEMAFHCSHCDFWIHFSCASATTGLIDYSKFQKVFEEGFRKLLPKD